MDWGTPVMILAMFRGPNDRVDVGGRYWGEWQRNSKNKGKLRIMVDSVELAIEPERVMNYQEYMNKFRANTLPENAAKKPWFLEHA